MYTKTISTNGGIFYHQEEKMMARLRDQKDTIQAKPEGDLIPQTGVASSSLSIGTSRRWSGFKNPRIVRVSRTFGGKDRHSKVCTIRGLRDRRIRLSVPTAIQLYDLQERLGLNQPSKVIDWLLDVTKLDIDELPPLHFPQFHDQHSLVGQASNNYTPSPHFSPYLGANLTLMNNQSSSLMLSPKEGININDNLNDVDKDEDEDQYQGSFLPSMMPNYSNFYNYDPSSLSLSQFGNHGFLPHSEDSNHQLSSSSSTQQLFFCPPLATTTASLFPHNDTSAAMSSAFYPSGSGLKSLAPHELHSAGASNTNQQIHKGENQTHL